MLNFKWLQKHILDRLNLVFIAYYFDKPTDNFPTTFPFRVGIVNKTKYNRENDRWLKKLL